MTDRSRLTGRDEVWDAVLFHIAYNDAEGFKRSDLDLDDKIGDNTVKRVLYAMEFLGWIRKESKNAHTYYAGDRLLFLAAVLRDREEE